MDEQLAILNSFFDAGDPIVVSTVAAFLFLVGACIASFSCLVAFRLARVSDDMPLISAISTPPSACDHCGRRLSVLNLVPVLGWLLARGRCGGCGCRVPARYPFFEALLGVACASAPFLFGGLNAMSIAAIFVACAAFLAAAIDWENSLVPEEVTWSLLFAGLLLSPFEGDIWSRVAGAGTGALLVWLSMALIGWWKRIDTRAIGDVAMGAAGGAWLGLMPVSWWLLAASAVHVLLCVKAAQKDEDGLRWLPFGPAMMGALPPMLVFCAYVATPS